MLVNAHYSNDGCRDYLGRVAGIHVENLISIAALFVCLFFALLSSYIFLRYALGFLRYPKHVGQAVVMWDRQ